jgi:UDP-3-O-[3-hydroxymyristoyl] glucosamine N-acyltransferase
MGLNTDAGSGVTELLNWDPTSDGMKGVGVTVGVSVMEGVSVIVGESVMVGLSVIVGESVMVGVKVGVGEG